MSHEIMSETNMLLLVLKGESAKNATDAVKPSGSCWSRMARKFDGQRLMSLYGGSLGGRCVVRRLSRWDNAWIFYDNPAYQPHQTDSSHGKL